MLFKKKIHRETCIPITGADAILTLSWPIFPDEKPLAMIVAAIAQALKSQGCSIKYQVGCPALA
jgi:hypothetical protein